MSIAQRNCQVNKKICFFFFYLVRCNKKGGNYYEFESTKVLKFSRLLVQYVEICRLTICGLCFKYMAMRLTEADEGLFAPLFFENGGEDYPARKNGANSPSSVKHRAGEI